MRKEEEEEDHWWRRGGRRGRRKKVSDAQWWSSGAITWNTQWTLCPLPFLLAMANCSTLLVEWVRKEKRRSRRRERGRRGCSYHWVTKIWGRPWNMNRKSDDHTSIQRWPAKLTCMSLLTCSLVNVTLSQARRTLTPVYAVLFSASSCSSSGISISVLKGQIECNKTFCPL